MKNYFLSRYCKELSPFVTTAVFKQYADKVDDYLVLRISKDPLDKDTVVFEELEPVGGTSYIKTGAWEGTPDLIVVLVNFDDDGIIMTEYNELTRIIQEHEKTNK